MKKINNDGYTLIEMMLSLAILMFVMAQIGSIMYSTTKLYRRGSSEVTLQKEAQQVVNMVEELLMDCDNNVSFNNSTKVMTIDNSAPYLSDYTISLRSGKLYLKAKDAAGETERLLAEGVKDFSLDTTALAYESRVMFSVEMEYDGYTYSSKKDVYLRNHIGSNDNGRGDGYTNKSDSSDSSESYAGENIYPMDILRFKDYDLSKELPADIKLTYGLDKCFFKAVNRVATTDGSGSTSLSYTPSSQTTYDLETDATGTTHIKCSTTLNGELAGTGSSYVLLQSQENTSFFIQCKTSDAVFGSKIYNDSGAGSITLDTDSPNTMSIITFEACDSSNKIPMYIKTSGISLEDCTEIQVIPMIKFSSDYLDESGDSDMNFYKIEYGSQIITPTDPDLIDEFGAPTATSKWKGFTSGDVCIPLCSPIILEKEFVGSTDVVKSVEASAGSLQSDEIIITLAHGGTGSGEDFVPDAGMFEGSDAKNAFKIKYNFGTVQYGPSKNSSGIFVDKSTNSLGCMTMMCDYSQGSMFGENLERESKFLEMGGELFFDIRLIYRDGTVSVSDETIFDCKAFLNITCSNDDCGEISSEAQAKMKEAFSSGMAVNVETDEDGNVVFTDNPSSGSSSGGGSSSSGSDSEEDGDDEGSDEEDSEEGGDEEGGDEISID